MIHFSVKSQILKLFGQIYIKRNLGENFNFNSTGKLKKINIQKPNIK